MDDNKIGTKFHIAIILVGLVAATGVSPTAWGQRLFPAQVEWGDIQVGGELRERLQRNFTRLHEDKYQPQHVFLTDEESGYWPGDTEGRTLLALVMDAQALRQEPLFLHRMMEQLPRHLNKQGYMGILYGDTISEQQLSGNGWLLRGLCEYYAWKGDKRILPIIRDIANNLFVKAQGRYSRYPIRPEQRRKDVGEASGTLQNVVDGWLLSSDVGCVFIGMEGLIHAYQYVGTPKMKEVIEEMIQRFLAIDLVDIKAQTHATLTACRGLIRYADLTGNRTLLDEAEKRWQLYKKYGMTANYENYNWFGRPDTWTEPCAIVDSYMLAVQLWQRTSKTEYRHDAELIYYNALCHTQRFNGGFGCDTCTSDEAGILSIHEPEAYWCCTMRGAEGLATAFRYSYLLQGDTLVVPFLRQSMLATGNEEKGFFSIRQTTEYPFSNQATLTIQENSRGINAISLPRLPWADETVFYLNGVPITPHEHNGFFVVKHSWQQGDTLTMTFRLKYHQGEPTLIFPSPRRGGPTLIFPSPRRGGVRGGVAVRDLQSPTTKASLRFFYGPLILGADAGTPSQLSPIYHLMDAKVWNKSYHKQILF